MKRPRLSYASASVSVRSISRRRIYASSNRLRSPVVKNSSQSSFVMAGISSGSISSAALTTGAMRVGRNPSPRRASRGSTCISANGSVTGRIPRPSKICPSMSLLPKSLPQRGTFRLSSYHIPRRPAPPLSPPRAKNRTFPRNLPKRPAPFPATLSKRRPAAPFAPPPPKTKRRGASAPRQKASRYHTHSILRNIRQQIYRKSKRSLGAISSTSASRKTTSNEAPTLPSSIADI